MATTLIDALTTAEWGTSTATSGSVAAFSILKTYNQASGTAANTDLLVNRTETAVGSGAQLLADFQVGGTSKLSLLNTGVWEKPTGQVHQWTVNGVQNGFLQATNVAFGDAALDSRTTGNKNVAIGQNAMTAATTTSDNVAIGADAMKALVAFGNGSSNVAVGTYAFDAATTGNYNTAVGWGVLSNGTSVGNEITAIGRSALLFNTASENTAVGSTTLDANTTGVRNAALGFAAGSAQAGANDSDNTWIGHSAGLAANGSASGSNTGVGSAVLNVLTTGIQNTAVGSGAGQVVTTGSANLFLGVNTDASATTAAGQIVIGDNFAATADSRVHIGDASSHIYADYNSAATWTHSSDARLKNFEGESPLGLSFINRIKTQQYRWKSNEQLEADGFGEFAKGRGMNTERLQHGVAAQDVKSAMDAEGVDEFAGWDQTPDGKQHVSEAAFVYPLIRAVNELTARIATLEAR